MNGKKSNFKRQLRRRTKTLLVLALMILFPIFQAAKSAFGFESTQDFLEDSIVWLIRIIALVGLLFLLKKLGVPFFKSRRPTRRRNFKQKSIRRKFSGSNELKKVIEYWNQSVVDGALSQLSERELLNSKLTITFDSFENGRLNREQLSGLEEIRSRSENLSVGHSEVLLAPLKFYESNKRNSSYAESIIPLWIPATISADGEILPPTGNIYPWIPRQYLEPIVGDSLVVLGDVVELENFEFTPQSRQSWKGYLKETEKLFKHITGDNFSKFSLDGLTKDERVLLFLNSNGHFGSQSVENHFNQILEYGANVGLLPSLAEVGGVKKKRTPTPSDSKSALRHLAQFQNRFSLSPSQRIAVEESLNLPNGEILAVTGPPGTGKTTIIQSIIGSMWTDAAIRGRAMPPITLCCSSSNQATTNILKSLTLAVGADSSGLDRWLPKVNSFGLFCSSKTRAEDITDTLYTLINGDGTLTDIENLQFIESALAFYLDKFSAKFFKVTKINKAISHLTKELWKEAELYKKELLTHSPIQLDLTRRFRLLELAVHYWEARWLLESPKLVRAQEAARGDRRNVFLSKEEWQIRSMLTPLLVSTFTMAPRFFGRASYDIGKDNLLNLLIADEAGQVPPEIGAAMFSMAEKAVVIGDVAQLEPVWSVSRAADEGNLSRFGLLKKGDRERLLLFESSGILASSGNLMSNALTACKIGNAIASGVLLAEQRRSVPKIVEFANALSYNGELTAVRSDLANRIFPAFGYVHVQGLASSAGRSRKNSIEANEIKNWLLAHNEKISQFYQKDITEAVAVITPFTAQTKLLRSLLLKEFPGMIVGTVNSLQGAEREIVLFSPVYDSSQKIRFVFDQKPNMLNVAVTRAKDSFLVFGDTKIFKAEGNYPTNILAKFLFESPENRLSVTSVVKESDNAPILNRLDTLAQHREALILAIRDAKQEVLIVSPTLSSHAIENDKVDFEIINAVSRGIRVIVYADLDLNSENGALKKSAEMATKMLAASGAELYIANRIHNKSLVIDDVVIYEGSFNWLSAVRTEGSKHQKFEVSFRHEGPEAKNQIRSLKYELNERKLYQVKPGN